jgi:hypothetical protein
VGRWLGFYRHHWKRLGTYPIVAVLSQTGKRIAGEIYDPRTISANTVMKYKNWTEAATGSFPSLPISEPKQDIV